MFINGFAIVLSAAIIASPLVLGTMALDELNDKPDGWHATPGNYVRIAFLSFGAGVVVWGLVRKGTRDELLFRCPGWSTLTATPMTFTFCLWGQ